MAESDTTLGIFKNELSAMDSKLSDDHKRWVVAYDISPSLSDLSLAYRVEMGKLLGPINVLYVGSGDTGSFARCLAASVGSCVSCTTIDVKSSPSIEGVKTHHHIQKKWEEVDDMDLGDNAVFEVMVLDVEPHGDESKIHARFVHKMRDVHLVVASCIGNFDTGAGGVANNFLEALHEKNVLHDYLMLENFYFRDVWAVVGTSARLRPIVHHLLGIQKPQLGWYGRLGFGGIPYGGYAEKIYTLWDVMRDKAKRAFGDPLAGQCLQTYLE